MEGFDMARYLQLNWKKCSKPRFVQSSFAHSRAVGYGNGYNVFVDDPAELHLLVFDDAADCAYESDDIIDSVRSILGWKRITEQRVEMLRNYFCDKTFDIKDGEIANIKDLLYQFIYD